MIKNKVLDEIEMPTLSFLLTEWGLYRIICHFDLCLVNLVAKIQKSGHENQVEERPENAPFLATF